MDWQIKYIKICASLFIIFSILLIGSMGYGIIKFNEGWDKMDEKLKDGSDIPLEEIGNVQRILFNYIIYVIIFGIPTIIFAVTTMGLMKSYDENKTLKQKESKLK